MTAKPLPDISILKDLLEYDSGTGILRWKHRPREMFKNDQAYGAWNTKYAGTIAGHQNAKTRRISVNLLGRMVFAHRICFTLKKGRNLTPSEKPDHRDGDPANNRADNLREADFAQNCCNRKKSRGQLPKGVTLYKRTGRFRAEIQFRGKRTHLGYFATAEEAEAAVRPVRETIHGEFAKHD